MYMELYGVLNLTLMYDHFDDNKKQIIHEFK